MKIAYYDESGDDGFPDYSSPLFVLSALYLDYRDWRDSIDRLVELRRSLKAEFGLPVKWEIHTKKFVLNKKPYCDLQLSDSQRCQVIEKLCDVLAALPLRIVNVVIVKPRIQNPTYKVLDRGLTYSVQRIDNDLRPSKNADQRFMMITDEGRVGAMCHTTRRIQRINYIPSRFGDYSYRKEIQSLIEDPLPKNSKESHFIQCADLVAYIVYVHALFETGVGNQHNRMPEIVTPTTVAGWLDRLKPALNLDASNSDRYGIVYHPK